MSEAEPKPAVPKPIRRWYGLTPDRFIIGLLLVECLIWLSERFQWFGFNEYKGWTVLIGVAVLGATILLMLVWFVVSLLFHIRFQFGIRSLLLLPVAVGVLCSWLVAEINESKREQEAAAALTKLGDVEWNKSSGPTWLRTLLGIDICNNVWYVQISGDQLADADLEHIEDLRHLVLLDLGETKTTDAGLKHIMRLNRLGGLRLYKTQITDAGLENLEGLKQLELLDLNWTEVSDAGLEHLKGLNKLRELELCEAHVTDAGLKHLEAMNQLQKLRLDAGEIPPMFPGSAQIRRFRLDTTHITDAGLDRLKGLTQLQWLELIGTQVTDAGLRYLEGLNRLRNLNLTGTKVTAEGVKKLHLALPNCKIIKSPPTPSRKERKRR